MQMASHEYREKKPSDLVKDHSAFLTILERKKRVQVVPGGRLIWMPARINRNQYIQRIDPTEEITLGHNEIIRGFEYSPKIYVAPTTITELEKAQNQGDAQFLDLLDEREEVAEDSLMNEVESDLQGDGTGYGGKAYSGVGTYVVANTLLGDVGGLPRAMYSAIRNVSIDAPATFGGPTDASNIEQRLRFAKNRCVRGADKPDFCLAGETYFNAACDAMSAKQRIVQDKELIEAGFDNIKIEGMLMVLSSGKVFSSLPRIAPDRCYGLASSTWFMKMYRGYNYQPVAKRISVNQLVDVSLLVGIGQLCNNNPGLNFLLRDS